MYTCRGLGHEIWVHLLPYMYAWHVCLICMPSGPTPRVCSSATWTKTNSRETPTRPRGDNGLQTPNLGCMDTKHWVYRHPTLGVWAPSIGCTDTKHLVYGHQTWHWVNMQAQSAAAAASMRQRDTAGTFMKYDQWMGSLKFVKTSLEGGSPVDTLKTALWSAECCLALPFAPLEYIICFESSCLKFAYRLAHKHQEKGPMLATWNYMLCICSMLTCVKTHVNMCYEIWSMLTWVYKHVDCAFAHAYCSN